jgi:hypothetical protein
MIPFWLKLLRANNKNRGYGLTLPFLIGAMRTPVGSVVVGKEQNMADAEHLLESIRDNTPNTSYISLTVCDRLHQPVFAECSIYFMPPDLHARIPKMDSEGCFLYVAPNILSQGENRIEDLLETLWKVNGDAILEGAFSFSNGAFAKYSDKDFALISSAEHIQENEGEA